MKTSRRLNAAQRDTNENFARARDRIVDLLDPQIRRSADFMKSHCSHTTARIRTPSRRTRPYANRSRADLARVEASRRSACGQPASPRFCSGPRRSSSPPAWPTPLRTIAPMLPDTLRETKTCSKRHAANRGPSSRKRGRRRVLGRFGGSRLRAGRNPGAMIEETAMVALIRATLPDAQVQVWDRTGTMDHFDVLIRSNAFAGKSLARPASAGRTGAQTGPRGRAHPRARHPHRTFGELNVRRDPQRDRT